MPSSLQSVLTNRFVLYAMLFLSVLTVIGYIALSDYLAIGVFVVAGIVASYFTKNMILVMGAAILAASALGVRGTVTKAVEAMTNKGDASKKTGAGTGVDADSDAGADADAVADDDADAAPADADAPAPATASTTPSSPQPANKKPSTGTKKQGFRDMGNKIRPAKVNASDELNDDEIIGKRIDYAATIEQAYDHLESMLGDKGMAGLTGETERLIKQQKTLMETLSTMAPVLETAKSTLGALNMTGLFGGMVGGAKKEKGATAPTSAPTGAK